MVSKSRCCGRLRGGHSESRRPGNRPGRRRGMLTGVVKDVSGGALPGVTVTVTSEVDAAER